MSYSNYTFAKVTFYNAEGNQITKQCVNVDNGAPDSEIVERVLRKLARDFIQVNYKTYQIERVML